MNLNQRTFENILAFGLVGACMFHPAAAAAGLLIVFGHQVADKYFTKNVSDADRREISVLKAEIEKQKVILQKEGLARAFTSRVPNGPI